MNANPEDIPNYIVQEIPNYVEGVKPKRAEFNTLEELLSIEWVKVKDSETTFHRFSLSSNRLMLEKDEGRWWWVVGYIKYPRRIDLPKWVAVKTEPS